MKGYFRTDIAVERPKYRTESNPLGRKQYLKGVGECPNDEYIMLAHYFTPDLIVEEKQEVKLEPIDSTDINPDDYEAEKVNQEEKTTESPKNKMISSPKKKDK